MKLQLFHDLYSAPANIIQIVLIADDIPAGMDAGNMIAQPILPASGNRCALAERKLIGIIMGIFCAAMDGGKISFIPEGFLQHAFKDGVGLFGGDDQYMLSIPDAIQVTGNE